MKLAIRFIFLLCVIYSCKNKANLSKNSKQNLIEIEYEDSKEKTIKKITEIWECKYPFIAKSEVNFNGIISNNISIMITDFKPVKNDQKKKNIILTIDLIKKDILNYRNFDKLEIITNYNSTEGERRTSNKTFIIQEL